MKVGMKRILTLLLAVLLVIPQVPLRTYGAEENPAEAGQSVTVTFAVGEEAYTNDPGSGQTHITVDEPVTGGELVYTPWAGRYKVTGTGTLCSFTIPAGTSLEQNGIALPKLNVTNIGTENTNTYLSSYSWADSRGMICNEDTVFSENTTLSVALYGDGESYSLNFVCGGGTCSGNHSIPYVLGGYPSATLSLGQSVSAPYIPSKADVDANYTSEWCSHGKDHGESFVKWQVKNTTTGEMVDFTAGTPITADYVENDDHSIKVYAVWGGEAVTATFMNGDTVVQTAEIPGGTALGELPSVTAPEGQRFRGWQYTDENGETRFATSQTVITQDTIFTAVFVTIEEVTVQILDIRFDGKTAQTLELSGEKGQTLEALFRNTALADGTALDRCLWYTVAEDGTKTKVQKDTVVEGDMQLYTYSYQLVLQLSPAEAASLRSVVVEENEDGGMTLTITAREGQLLAASDFVVDGVDYTTYAWETAGGQPVNIQNLIADGITENITLMGTRQATAQMSINFYVAVDGRWILLTHQEMEVYQLQEGRYYITAGQLESVYGEYGFRAEQLEAETRYFPHTTRDDETIWGDSAAVIKDGVAYSPILRAENVYQCDVYYLPNQSCTNSGGKNSYLSSDSFYSVVVLDPEGIVYQSDELPPVAYHVKDSMATVTLNAPEDVHWQCIGDDGTQIESYTDNGDGTVTFTISRISQPYTLTPSQSGTVKKVVYHINITEPPKDEEYGRPTIQGGETFQVLETGNIHRALAPSMTVYFYESDTKYLGQATFRGWLINDTQKLIQPGEELNLEQYGPTIRLTAKWEFSIGGTDPDEGAVNKSSMVNFFVALKAAPEGSVSWAGNIQASAFTDSVFTADCGVTGKEAVDYHLYSGDPVQVGGIKQYFVLGDTGGNNLNALHNQVVTNLTNGYQKEGNNHQNYTFQLDFPTDEQVLRQVRSMVADGTVITLNGKTVKVEDLNADNFTVKWHVFKFDETDGWHVDGVLVAKVGTMRITKTFAGDAEAIEAVKNGFQIRVEAVENEFVAPHPGATLTLEDASFNPDTNTYTWEIEVDQYRDYEITEENYIPEDAYVETSARYMVNGSKYMEQNTGGWLAFTGTDITVTGQTRGQNRVQTVSFLNSYTKPGVITLKKVDAFTGTLMANVSFTIEKNGNPLKLYRLADGSYTIEDDKGGELVSGITTDINGQVFLFLGTGTFTFREIVPNGYDDPGAITVVVDEDGTITQAYAENDNEDLNRKFARINTSTEIQVNNYSKTVPVTIHKNWADGENREVVLQLYCNGQSMGVQNFSKTLNGGADNWTHTFTLTVPLYIDGQPAQYSLLETRIGDWLYSEEYSGDGYRYYDVSYNPAVYRDGAGHSTDDIANAQEIYLEVSNRRTTGQLIIRKTDENNRPLGGAEFYLYRGSVNNPGYVTVTKDADGHNVLEGLELVKRVTSAASGDTAFGNIPTGNYYLIEHAAPQFYQGTDAVYLVEISGTESVMKRWQDDQWVAVGNTTIVNTRQVIPVTIDKTVGGNMGDHTKTFDFTVDSDLPMEAGTGYTLSADKLTATFRLTHGQNITLNVRRGATLTITEDNAQGYLMTLTLDDNPVEGNSVTIPGDAVHTFVHVRNTKNLEVDTGVILDSLPYVLLLSTAGCGSLLLAGGRKRRKKQ